METLEENLEFIKNLSETDGKLSSILDIAVSKAVQMNFPNLVWVNYEKRARVMKLVNTGKTIIIFPKFDGEAPYIRGGPLGGAYRLSQLQFHWSGMNFEGSVHTVDGVHMPVEMHAIHIRAGYTEEEAFKKPDGLMTVVQFYKMSFEQSRPLQQLACQIPKVRQAGSEISIRVFPISSVLFPFPIDYYLYWGSSKIAEPKQCSEDSDAATILWIISRETGSISLEQMEFFKYLKNCNNQEKPRKFKSASVIVGEIHSRKLYHINPLHPFTNSTLSPVPHRKDYQEKMRKIINKRADSELVFKEKLEQ